jgi:hypothetical protein
MVHKESPGAVAGELKLRLDGVAKHFLVWAFGPDGMPWGTSGLSVTFLDRSSLADAIRDRSRQEVGVVTCQPCALSRCHILTGQRLKA